ncbi:MAG TPA: ShlB/FhaC/HecB family hemolysin secretion/activation protein [Allosphingosinicella sp.]|uniref:ShlB/FhaC/HecB family hemolysin secretion/activation protein n=1 Tax=Allosphingosinicella sp. TaxID=2823234 RepID=UPI002ED7974F
MLLTAAFPAGVAAQNSLPSREELQPAERTAVERRAQTTGIVGRLDAGPCPFETSNLSFTLEAVDFSGLTAVPAERLAPAWTGVRGQNVPVAEICRIRDRAAEILLNEGYLARVEIPPQQITGGRVQLQVVEAHIASVQVTGSAGGAQRKVRDYVSRLQGLAPFNMDVVQRQILLAADVPGVTISTNIRPAQGTAGAVELVVQVDHEPVNVLTAFQNYGSSAVGPWTVLGRVDLNSLTPLGERTSLVLSTDPSFEEQQVLQILQEARLGADGLLARGSIALGETHPRAALAPLEIESQSFVGELGLAYPIIRHRRRNLWISGGIEFVNQTTDLFDGRARLIDDKLRVLSGRLEADQRFSLFSLPIFGSGSIELRKGLDAFGASERGEATLSRTAANPEAWAARLSGRTEWLLMPRFSLATASLLQWADDPLLAYEELSIGNYTIGRGYDPGSVSGDRGAASSLELRYGPVQLGQSNAQVFGFFDSAWVENLDPGSGQHTVRSVGGGMRINLGRTFSLDVAYAHPMDAPVPGGPKADDRLLINLISRIR